VHRNHRFVRVFSAFLFVVGLTSTTTFGQLSPELRAKIDKLAASSLAKSGVPSASVAVVKDGQVVYLNAYGDKLDHAFTSIPEAELRFVVNGRFGPNQGVAGVILKPWGERARSAQQIKTVLQQKVSAVEGMNAFAFSLPPLPASIGGLPVQMVIDSTGDFVPIFQAMEQIKAAARKSGLFIVTDSDLAFNQPTIR